MLERNIFRRLDPVAPMSDARRILDQRGRFGALPPPTYLRHERPPEGDRLTVINRSGRQPNLAKRNESHGVDMRPLNISSITDAGAVVGGVVEINSYAETNDRAGGSLLIAADLSGLVNRALGRAADPVQCGGTWQDDPRRDESHSRQRVRARA